MKSNSKNKPQSGFTLIEVLVVMFIIGIMVGMGMLSLRGTSLDEKMQEEVRRLNALMELAQEEAILRSSEMGVYFDADRYTFLMLDEGSWYQITDDDLFRERSLPDGIFLTFETLEDYEVEESESSEENLVPQVLMLSSGEITPFTLTFEAQDSGTQMILTATFDGTLENKTVSQ